MQTYIVYSSKSYTMVDDTNDQYTMNINVHSNISFGSPYPTQLSENKNKNI